MSTDFRALCAELASYLQGRKDLEYGWPGEDPEQDLIARTYAALAQSEPVAPYSSAAIAWEAEEAQRAIDISARVKRTAELYAKFIDPSMGAPWDEGHTERDATN